MPQVRIFSESIISDAIEKEINTESPVFEVPVKLNQGSGVVEIEALIYYCDTENEGICKFRDLYFEIPVNSSALGKDVIDIGYKLN